MCRLSIARYFACMWQRSGQNIRSRLLGCYRAGVPLIDTRPPIGCQTLPVQDRTKMPAVAESSENATTGFPFTSKAMDVERAFPAASNGVPRVVQLVPLN